MSSARKRAFEKDVSGNPWRFWARINGRRLKDSMSCIHDENGQVLVDEVEVTERWKELFKGLYGDMERWLKSGLGCTRA